MTKILIPNATGPLNMGDQAILYGLIGLINEKYRNPHIIIHTTNPELYKNNDPNIEIKPHTYFWSMFENTNSSIRLLRFMQILTSLTLLKVGLNPKLFISGRLNDLLQDYETSDIIITIGGGYFRSTKKLTQSLNLLMLILIFEFAGLYKDKTIISPMGFGPFAYKWQERLSAGILKKFKHIYTREEFSYNLLKKYGVNDVILSCDLAIMLENINLRKNADIPILGFTIRNWRKPSSQKSLEECFAVAIANFYRTTNCKILPIIQVQGEDDDSKATDSVVKILRQRGIPVLVHQTIENVRHAQEIYGSIDILLGMRMHSNIIAATQGIPFVAVSYEYKTEGIAKYLGMDDYCIKQEDVTGEKLSKLLINLYSNRRAVVSKMHESIESAKNKLKTSFEL